MKIEYQECSMCDNDRVKELNYIDPNDDNGFCNKCWSQIQKTNSLNYYDNYPKEDSIK